MADDDRAQCPVCHHSIAVRDGVLASHADPREGRTGECHGSGRPPA